MTRQELRAFLNDWFCGCADPASAAKALHDLLALHPLYENRDKVPALLPEHLESLVLYTLDHFDLTEHGGTVGGGWLTEKGQVVLEALKLEVDDNFEVLTEQSCMHGYAVETELKDCPECGPLNR